MNEENQELKYNGKPFDIFQEQYYVFPETTVTVCCLTLNCGYSVVGQSFFAKDSQFEERYGREIAYNDAVREVERMKKMDYCLDVFCGLTPDYPIEDEEE